MNGTVAVLAKLVLILGWMVQGSRASSPDRGTGLEVSFPWELYLVAALALVASIALWEAVKWLLEWISLRRSGTVSEARGARGLRRLQQAISEEVARYDLDGPEEVLEGLTPRPTASRNSTPRPSPMRQSSTMQSSSLPPSSSSMPTRSTRITTSTVGTQTDPMNHGYQEFRGPFVMSEHGDRVHYHPIVMASGML